jgi:signal peptide peptidase SppA
LKEETRVLAAICGAEWAISPDALRGILAIARRENDAPEAVEARLGRKLENTHQSEVRGSVAVIPVTGPLFRRAGAFTRVSGATSYDMVAQDVRAALDNPAVRSIVLNIDSPGGMVNGVSELASHIFEARQSKDVIAYVGGTGASAAYWLASAASRIVASKTATLGSVGVVVGVGKGKGDVEEIVSSQSPYKRTDPSTEEGRARIQAHVDNLAAIFIEDVAKHRGASVEHVSANFGQGDVLLGASAVEAGMADELGTYEGLIAKLNEKQTSRPAIHEVKAMDIQQLRAEQPGLVDQILAEGRASVDVGGAKAEAANAERARVLGIIGHAEAQGRAPLALELANTPDMTVERAAKFLSATPKAETAAPAASKPTEFERHMAKLNPDVKPDAPTSEGSGDAELQAHLAAMRKIEEERLAANRRTH